MLFGRLVLVIKPHDLDTDGLNIATSRNQHDEGWYNVVDTGIVTRVWASVFFDVSTMKFPSSLDCL